MVSSAASTIISGAFTKKLLPKMNLLSINFNRVDDENDVG